MFILKSRWKLLGHLLLLSEECPPNKAMLFYFENTSAKGFRGHPRTTIVTTLNSDIKRTKEKEPLFPVRKLATSEDLAHVRQLVWAGKVSLDLSTTSLKMRNHTNLCFQIDTALIMTRRRPITVY